METDELAKLWSACGGGVQPLRRELDVTKDRVYAVDRESKALREGQRMSSLATTNVEHVCARRQMESLYELVQQLRPARAQARIEGAFEFGLAAREGVVGLLEREGFSVVHRRIVGWLAFHSGPTYAVDHNDRPCATT